MCAYLQPRPLLKTVDTLPLLQILQRPDKQKLDKIGLWNPLIQAPALYPCTWGTFALPQIFTYYTCAAVCYILSASQSLDIQAGPVGKS